VGKPLGHDQFNHLYSTACLDTITIKNHKSNSKFDSEIGVARNIINPLNAKLNPICYLLALLEAHHILHVSRIMVKVI
jgi:hypothetical protein